MCLARSQLGLVFSWIGQRYRSVRDFLFLGGFGWCHMEKKTSTFEGLHYEVVLLLLPFGLHMLQAPDGLPSVLQVLALEGYTLVI